MRSLVLVCALILAACAVPPEVPERPFQDFVPLAGELPAGLNFTRMDETQRIVNYSHNPGFILPEHYDQLYLHPDAARIDQVLYVYLVPNGTYAAGGELGIFVMRFVDDLAADAELDKVKDYVYFKDIRNFYIGRSGRYILEFWSDASGDDRLRDLFLAMQSRIGFEEVQPIG